ncbi:MAG: 5'-methylthioadenosine/adenosylhomocysteine nucleosidase [Clostridia bacterium]|nr:5'-methylthioadenosine/adenosylhomocysteine nucleosidase [Clostridia bacterium]
MIGIICAMQIEIDKINEAIENKRTETVSGIVFTSGTLHGKEVVTAVSGVGKVFAAICTEAMILRYNPDAIINTGVAGTLTHKLGICDVAVSAQVVQHDMDTSPLGDPVGLLSGINIVKIPADEKIAKEMAACVEKIGLKSLIGTIASGDQFINSAEKKSFIAKEFDAIACEMEGGSVGHVCYVNHTPFAVIRAISDGAGDDSHMDYPTFASIAAQKSAEAVKLFVKECC